MIFIKMPTVLVHSMVYPKLLKNVHIVNLELLFFFLKRPFLNHVSLNRKSQNIKMCGKILEILRILNKILFSFFKAIPVMRLNSGRGHCVGSNDLERSLL